MKKIIFLLITFYSTAIWAKPIAESAYEISPLLNGQTVPNVTVTDINNQKTPLLTLLKNQKTVLFFYRGGWCPFCNTQLGQLKKIEARLNEMGFQLIGISTDDVSDLNESISKHKLNYQLLSDFHSTISQAFGLAYFASEKTTQRYVDMLKLTNPLQENKLKEKRLVLPVPAVYVLDKNGVVQFNYVNPNIKVRLHEALLLKSAELISD